MAVLGIFIFVCMAGWFLHRYFRTSRPHRFPREGYVGAAALLISEVLLFAEVEPVATYFTPIAWTAYIFWADAAVFSIRGKSLWQTYRSEFVCLALCSIPLWLVFEAFNLRLANWVYVGLPENWLARQFGYAWSFATIWPGIFETATLLRALRVIQPSLPKESLCNRAAYSRKPARLLDRTKTLTLLSGIILLTVPVLVPQRIGAYLFGAVWLGFILLLEPINFHWGRQSLWRDWKQGDTSRLKALLAAGLICGLLWEFWNYWAQARWVYTVPILPEWKIFAMPLLGYLGFPPFAVECFVMFAFVAPFLDKVLRKAGCKEHNWGEALQL